jgi:heat shock protein HslJ
MWLLFLCVVLLALLGGCRAAESTPTPANTPSPAEAKATTDARAEAVVAAFPLAATAWELDHFGSPEDQTPLLPDTRASVFYFWDRYVGFDGCNWFLGVYEADQAGGLTMQTPGHTRAVCEDEDLQQQSSTYFSALLLTTNYSIEGEQLIASSNGQPMLTFSAAQPAPMPGTEWELKLWWWADRQLWNTVLPFSSTTITFGLDGEASGSGGCNNYTVPVEGDLQIEKVMEATDTYAELPTLRFGPITAETAACTEPAGIMDQEQAYFATLDSTAYYFKLGGMLMLLDEQGVPLLVFAARS